MPQAEQKLDLAIVFSDIVGSSRLYASLGNARAKQKIDQAIGIMRDIVVQHQGTVIKTIGDEIMCSFSEPEIACAAATNMNQTLNAMHFYLRTGVSFGPVIHDQNDLYGDTVNNAAFLARTAQASQILLDGNTYSNLDLRREQCEFFDRIKLKGENEASLIYRLNWEKNDNTALDATVVSSKIVAAARQLDSKLIIKLEDQTFVVNENTEVIVGRDQGSVQICVAHKNASRKHCSFCFNRGKFILRDHSTNGTYLLQSGYKEVFLRRESTPLLSDGVVSIGQSNKGSDLKLEYFLE
ncbi:MAG: adenylate/guanylate cyclase domain-containing protein [Agarilytica sp.]